MTFRVGRPSTDFVITARTDTDGIVAFEIMDLPYRGTIRVVEELPPQTTHVVACCVDGAGTPLSISSEPFPGNEPLIRVAQLSVGATGDVRCDWYNVPTS